jgi:two-component system OmpR family sensor kinase
MAPRAGLRAIEIGVDAVRDFPLQGQPEALRILLRNLVDNAIKYTPTGGRVDVSVVDEAGDTVVVVEDSGPGVAESDRARVLDRFYRVPGETAPGSGLGLAIVSAIAQWHGAQLSLDRSERLGGLRVAVRWANRSTFDAGR